MKPARLAQVVMLLAAGGASVGRSVAQTPLTLADEIVSRNNGGTRAAGGSSDAVISGDGRYVAFASGAANLVPSDTNNALDVFVFDRVTATIRRASVDANGVQGNGTSRQAAITPDGRYVAFSSVATNLVSGDADGVADIFLKDMQTGAIQRVTATTSFAANETCDAPDVSDNAQVLAYRCGFAPESLGLVRHDIGAGSRATLVVDSIFGVISEPRVSGDGRSVAFVASKNLLVANDSNGLPDAFVYLHDDASTRLVSNAQNGGSPLGVVSDPPAIRFDGCEIAFASSNSGFVAGDFALEQDVFVRDVCANRVERVTLDAQGFEAQGPSARPAISADGRYVAFHTSANNLRPANDLVSGNTLAVRDRNPPGNSLGIDTFVVGGETFGDFAIQPALSDDGRHLAAQASGSVPGDQMIAVGNTLLFSQPTAPVVGPNGGEVFAPVPSSGGDLVLVSSDAAGFDQGWSGQDADGIQDTFVFRPESESNSACMEQISMSSGDFNSPCFNPDAQRRDASKGSGGPAVPCGSIPPETVTEICAPTLEPTLAAGRMLAAFVTDDAAVNFVHGETKSQRDRRKQTGETGVYLRSLVTGTLFRVGTALPGGTGTGPQLAADGRSIVFVTNVRMTSEDENNGADAYQVRIKPDPANGFELPRCLSCKNLDGSSNPPGTKHPAVSANGNVVAMSVPVAGGGFQILLRNLVTNTSQRLGTASGQSQQPRLDFSGGQLVFGSNANLDGSDANGKVDVYHYESCCNKLTRVSKPGAGDADQDSVDPAISGDGRSVSFVSRATNLDPSDPANNAQQHVFVQRLVGARERLRLARNAQGQLADDDSFRPALNYNGTALFYDSLASNLKDGEDFNPGLDVFRRSNPLTAQTVFGTGFE